jgi:hypothetical protein
MADVIDDGDGVLREPASLEEWWAWFRAMGPGRVVGSYDNGSVRISTVCLGNDATCGLSSPPKYYETMAWGLTEDEYLERYTTRAEAIAGHERAVDLARQRGN